MLFLHKKQRHTTKFHLFYFKKLKERTKKRKEKTNKEKGKTKTKPYSIHGRSMYKVPGVQNSTDMIGLQRISISSTKSSKSNGCDRVFMCNSNLSKEHLLVY